MGKNKELGTDSMGIKKTMRMKDYFGDGVGQLPLNALSCLVGQLTYFYTEKVGLAAASVATMLILAKFLDAFTDFGYAIGMVVTIGLIPITNALGGNQSAWIKVAVIMAALSALSLLILYRSAKEKNAGEKSADQLEEEAMPFTKEIGMLFKNKYWVLMLIANLLMNISYGLSSSGGTYYAKYILGNDNIVALLGAVGMIPTLLGFIFVGPLTKKIGMAKTCLLGCIVGIIGCIYRVFTPYSLVSCLVGGGMATFANIPIMCLSGALVNNCVEYNDWKFGKKLVGMSNSASSFGSKIGSGIGGSLIGWILGACGFISGAAVADQPSSVISGIFAFSIYIPLVLLVVLAVIFSRYDLEKIYPRIMKELSEKKKSEGKDEK